jgi:hypothetical protein
VRYLLSVPVEEVPALGESPALPVEMPPVLAVEEIRKLQDEEAAQRRLVWNQPMPPAAAIDPHQPLHPPFAPAPPVVKAHTLPVLVAEAVAERKSDDEDWYQSPSLPAPNTELDRLLSERHSERDWIQPAGDHYVSRAAFLVLMMLLFMLCAAVSLFLSQAH